MLAQQIYNLIQPFVQQDFIVPRSIDIITNSISEFIIIQHNNKVIACCGLKEHNSASEIYCLAIDGCYHGRGLAKELLLAVEKKTHNTLVAMSKYQGEWFIKQGFVHGSVDDLPVSVDYNHIRRPNIFLKQR